MGGLVKCNGKGEACASVTELKDRLRSLNGGSSIIKRMADFDGDRKGASWMSRAAREEVRLLFIFNSRAQCSMRASVCALLAP